MLDTVVGGIASMLAVLLVLLTSAIFLRFTARIKQQVSLGPDDWFMVPVWFCFVGSFVVGVYGMSNNLIGHKAPKDPKDIAALVPKLAEILWVNDLVAIIGIGCVRLSALFFYRRIFDIQRTGDVFMILTAIMIGIVTLWTLAYTFLTIFQCGIHVSSIWLAARTCPSITYPFLIGWAISSFLLDFLVLVLPLPKIWLLHTNSKRKFSILIVFLLALAGLGASCARMIIWIKLWKNGPAGNALDVLETNSQGYYFVVLEVGLCAIAANLPSLWYFRRDIKPEKLLQSIRSFASLRSSRSSLPGSSDDSERAPFNTVSSGNSAGSSSQGIPSKRDEMERAAAQFSNGSQV